MLNVIDPAADGLCESVGTVTNAVDSSLTALGAITNPPTWRWC